MDEPSAPQGGNASNNQVAQNDPITPQAHVNYKNAGEKIAEYLCERSEEYRRLSKLRKQGWDNPVGDAFFQKQRENADNCSAKTARKFYHLMQKIGEELHLATKAFAPSIDDWRPIHILDMCMAPGGFLATALSKSAGSKAVAFSLPVPQGGHKVLLPMRLKVVDTRFLDITMLAEDMGVDHIPQDHPDANNFVSRQLKPYQHFGLALCDGQVLRTHERSSYREKKEARRLTNTQLALSLEHLLPGGTMVVLLHKIDAWDTIQIVQQFHKFATVKLFKPTTGHAKRSSFYMVASNVESRHPAASEAIGRWKATWEADTFHFEDDCRRETASAELEVMALLQDFGEDLLRLGEPIWKVQADALAKAPFIRSGDQT